MFKERIKAQISELKDSVNALKDMVAALTARFVGKKFKKDNKEKNDKGKSGGKKDGGKKGAKKKNYARSGPKRPQNPDKTVHLDDPYCRDCGNLMSEPTDSYERYIQDIIIRPLVLKYIVNRRFCKCCNKQQSAKIPDALPHEPFGMRLMLLITSMNLLGVSYGKMSEFIATFFGIRVSHAAANRIVMRIAKEFGPLYDVMVKEMRKQASIHGDETRWKIKGVNHWLWAFISKYAVIYEIDKSRGRDVPKKVMGDYKGTVISDSWGAWNYIGSKHQSHTLCQVHRRRAGYTDEFERFGRTFKRILYDSHKPKAVHTKDRRIHRLIARKYEDRHCRRIVKRLKREKDMLFTFLEEEIDWHNNTAERALRPSVVMRKITYGNRSEEGARSHRTLMSVWQTCRMNQADFYEFAMEYLGGTSKK